MTKIIPFLRTSIFIATSFLLAFYPTASSAQDSASANDVKFQLFEFGNAITGDRLNIDENYSLAHKIPVPAPFSVLIPRENGVLRLAENAPEGPTGPYLKLSFTSEDEQLIENIRLVPMTIALDADDDKRMEALASIMAGKVYETAVQGALNHSRDVVRKTIIGGLPAVEVIGRYQDPELGVVYLRIVGIPNPKGSAGLFVVANVVAAKLELAQPDDFSRTRGGVMLREFKFLSY